MIRFDPASLKDWKTRGITDVWVELYRSGCAGTKIRVSEWAPRQTDRFDEISNDRWTVSESAGLRIHVRQPEQDKLKNSRLTQVGGKWILASDSVKSRCGCGSSFSFEVGPTPRSEHSEREHTTSEGLAERIAQAKMKFTTKLGTQKY